MRGDGLSALLSGTREGMDDRQRTINRVQAHGYVYTNRIIAGLEALVIGLRHAQNPTSSNGDAMKLLRALGGHNDRVEL